LDTDQKVLVSNLAQLKAAHAEEIKKLQSSLSEFQARLRESKVELWNLQHRYESRTKEVHQIRKERENLAEQVAKLEQRTAKQQEELTKLKDERSGLKHDIEAARNELKEEGGLLAELEVVREENRKLVKENSSLERKAEYEKKQAEYTREQYQNASTAAAQSGTEVRQLRDENTELKRRIDAELAKLREVKARNDEVRHLQRVQELEQSIEMREDLLRRKEDELRNIRNNRPTTRATSSQPRSPKWGPGNSRPTSPGVNNSGLPGRSSALRFSSEMSL
jgi:chromosome segregation ATPase